MKNENTVEKYQKYVLPTYTPDLVLDKGEGTHVWDDSGRKYLDFVMGISVCNLGHCHPKVSKAIADQALRLVHVSNLYINQNQAELANKLTAQGMDGAAFFSNSGAEANEGMIKFARKWGSKAGKFEIITMEGSFHGRTLATLAATGQSKYRCNFAPDLPGFAHVPFNDLEAASSAVNDRTAAILVEPVQGEGGVLPSADGYLAGLRKLCDDKNILLLFDEVQCGMGRCGEFYCYTKYGVEPDAFSIAKALGNGFPIGSFIVSRKHAGVLAAGEHASTFGGSPLACAAAIAVLDTIADEGLLENCRCQSDLANKMLNELRIRHDVISEVRGLGLMIGVNLKPELPVKDVLKGLREKGLLALPAGNNVLRLLPPLNVKSEEIEEAVSIIDSTLTSLR